MAYIEEQAQERARARQQMLGGQQPQAIGQADPENPQPQGVQLPTNLSDMLAAVQQFLAQSAAPKGIKVDPVKELEVPMMIPGRPPAPEPEHWRGGDVDLGGAISSMFGNAKGSALQDMLRRSQPPGADPRDRSTTGVAERAQRLRDSTPGPYAKGEAATQYVQEKIPGLKPGIDASKAEPGRPAADAYMEQQKGGGAIRMAEKGATSAGYQDDLAFLQERGGHTTNIVDGEKTHTPLTQKGAYKDLDPELAARLRHAAETYEKETGKRAKFGEFSRGEDVQKIYWEESEHGTKYAAASPGKSRHQHGGAGDLPSGDFQDWMHKNGDAHGVHFPVKNDAPHVELNPANKTTFARTGPDTPALPPWDKGLPQEKVATDWPDPSQTTPADTITARPVDTGPAGGEQTLAAQRAGYKAHADADPTFRERAAAIMSLESYTPEGQQGTFEAMLNRVKANNRAVTDAIDPNYHADYMVRNSAKFDAKVAEIRKNPELRKQLYGLQDKVFAGSNISKLATDYASRGLADSNARTSTETYASPDGQRFFRKDRDPVKDGPGQVAANKKWYKETTEAMAKPAGAPAGPDAGTVEVAGSAPSATSAPSAMRTADVFEKGAEATPVPGVGGLQEDVDYAGLQPTTTTTQDSAGAALNAVTKPETAAAPPVPAPPAAAPPVAVTPSPPPAAAVAPAPPPPRPAPAPAPAAAAPPVKQQTGLDRAHALLDMRAGDFVRKYAPEHLGKVQSFGVENTPLRELVQKPFVGSQIVNGLAPAMESKFGFKMDDFQKAMTQPSPSAGRRSEAPVGTLAPEGLQTGLTAKAGLPPATGPSTANMTPYKDFEPYKGEIEDRRGDPGTGKRMLAKSLGMEGASPHTDYTWSFAPDARERAAQDTPLSREAGLQDIIKGEEATNAARALEAERAPADIPPMTPAEIEEMRRSVALANEPAQQFAGAPPTPQQQSPVAPQVTPSIADALVKSVQDQGPSPVDMKPSPEALPVLPATEVAPPAPGMPGGLSLAPPGLDLAAPGAGPFQTAMGAPGSQGGAIATLGMLPQIQQSTFSTPLLDQQARSPTMGQGSLSPIPWQTMSGWGWGGGPSAGIGDFGGGGGGGFSGGGGGLMGGGGGLFPMPITWGG